MSHLSQLKARYSLGSPHCRFISAMASKNRRHLVVCLLALLCLLLVSSLHQIGAETSELEADAGEEDVNDSGETVQDGEYENEEEGDEDEEEEDSEENGGEKADFDETDVVVLGSNNFTAFVTTEQYVLVEFYAPWCGHCQELAPEWAAAATVLKGRNISVAKVEATSHTDISESLGVSSYPTLFFFIDSGHIPYTGERTKDAIVNYVNTKLSLTIRALSSVSEAEPLLEAKSPIAVAYLNKLEGVEVNEMTSVARQEEGVIFYLTSDENVAALFGLDKETKPALVLLKNVPDKRLVFNSIFKRKELYDFVFANKLPLVIFYNQATQPLVFGNAIKNQILCFVKDDEHWDYAQELFEKVARMFRGQALFIRMHLGDSDGQQASEFFGVTRESPSITIMAFMTSEDGPKYLYEGKFTVEGVKGFVQGFLANKLSPYYKSQRIPEQNNEDVKVAVGKNFEEIVLDESKDTLLELYSVGCHYCEDLEPIYKKLAKRLKSIPSLSIVKMDGILNEHPRARPDGYPTILFYPAGKKSFEPITFEGDRTVKGFYQFLKKHAAIPFALPRTAKSKASTKATEDIKDEL